MDITIESSLWRKKGVRLEGVVSRDKENSVYFLVVRRSHSGSAVGVQQTTQRTMRTANQLANQPIRTWVNEIVKYWE